MSIGELAVLDADGREVARVALDENPVTIGRAEGNTVILEDTLASRFHARIEPDDGGYAVLDRGSKNGTLVNGTPVSRIALAPDDEILIGETRLRCVAAPAPVLATAPICGDADPGVTVYEPAPEPAPEPEAEDGETAGEPAMMVLYERPGTPVTPAHELAESRAAVTGSGSRARMAVSASEPAPPGTLEALAGFAEAVASIPHELSSLDDVAGRLLGLVECERATILIVEEGTEKPLVQYSRSTTLADDAGGPADEVIQAALTTERPVSIRVPRAREVLSATLNATRHLLLVPVRSSGRKLGLVALEREPDQLPFEEEELAMVRSAGAQIATFLRSVL